MDLKASLLPQRARVAYWSPVLVFLLIAALNMTPFAGMDFEMEYSDEEFEDDTSSIDFYPDHYLVEASFNQAEENPDVFGGRTATTLNYDGGEEIEEIGELADMVSGRLANITLIGSLILILGFACRRERLDANRTLNGRNLAGAGLAIIAILSLTMSVTIVQDFGEIQDAYNEDQYNDDSAVEINEGAWGKIIFEDELSTETSKWAPGSLFWIGLLVALCSGIGAVANLSYLKEDLDIEDAEIWPNGITPQWFVRDWTKTVFGVMGVAVMIALFAPWYEVDQEWLKSRTNGNEMAVNSTHELGWVMNPFYLSFTNDSGLFESDGGDQESGISGYDERYELGNIAPILLGLRTPLVCIGLLALGWAAFQFSKRTSERIGAPQESWSLILLSLITLVVLLSNVASFEKDMTRRADGDLADMSPVLNFTVSHSVDDLFSGQSYTVDFDFEGFSNEGEPIMTTYYGIMEWGPSWGYFAMRALPWLFLTSICLRFGPEVVERLNKENFSFEMSVDREVWGARPVVAVMVASLLVTVVGIGPGELLDSSQSDAPGKLYQWQIDWDSGDYYDAESNLIMADQETLVLSYTTTDHSLTQTTGMYLFMECYEGDQGELTDFSDEFSWQITPPEGVDTGSLTTSGTVECGQYVNDYLASDVNVPNEEWAPTEAAYLSLVEIINPLDGDWTFSITAQVNEGSDPFSSDSNLEFSYEIGFYSIENLRAEKVE